MHWIIHSQLSAVHLGIALEYSSHSTALHDYSTNSPPEGAAEQETAALTWFTGEWTLVELNFQPP